MSFLRNCRVVLVRTHYAGNIGAAARAMKNFGLRDLVLVEPVADPLEREARRLAAHGEAILENARVVREFGDAVADCQLVLATSAVVEGVVRERSVGTPEELLARLVPRLDDGPCALVFGPEPSGLSNAEIMRCHGLIHIPADPDYPALNLAHAVAVCVYELRKQWLTRARRRPTAPPVAAFAEHERVFESLRAGLEAIHFLYGPKAPALMHAVRHLLGRAAPDQQEIKVLFGLARQLHWIAAKAWGQDPPDDSSSPGEPPDAAQPL